MAYLDGEAELGVAEHLARCPHCRSRAAALDTQERPFRAWLFRIECPSPDAWRDFYFGLLPDDLSVSLAAHLHECPDCTREMLILQAFVPLPTSGPAAPPAMTLAGLRWWVAQLLRRPPMSPAVAQTGNDARRPLWIYRAGEMRLEIDSRADPAQPDCRSLEGTFFADQPVGWRAYLWRASRRVATTPVDDRGGFRFAGLPPAGYDLTLTGPQTRIYFPELTLA